MTTEGIIKDFANWLDCNDKLKLKRQTPPFENSETIANYYNEKILPTIKIMKREPKEFKEYRELKNITIKFDSKVYTLVCVIKKK